MKNKIKNWWESFKWASKQKSMVVSNMNEIIQKQPGSYAAYVAETTLKYLEGK